MIGVIGLVLINAKQLSDDFKKRINFSIMLKNNVNESELLRFNKALAAKDYVVSTDYVSKEEGMRKLQEELRKEENDSTDHLALLDGEIPVPNSIDIKFKPEYTHSDSIKNIEEELIQSNFVHEIVFNDDLNYKIQQNSKTISLYILAIAGILMIVAVALINNTIKLTVYSKRFIIRTMQLVGATSGFIQRPFMLSGIIQGFIGGVSAVLLLVGFINVAQNQLPDLKLVENQELQLLLFVGVIALGVFFTWLSTALAVRKYLRKNLDQLTLG